VVWKRDLLMPAAKRDLMYGGKRDLLIPEKRPTDTCGQKGRYSSNTLLRQSSKRPTDTGKETFYYLRPKGKIQQQHPPQV